MRPTRYMDFELLTSDAGAGIPAPLIASRMMQVFHGVFSAHPGEYALALPGWGDGVGDGGYPWQPLRVFAEGMESLDALMQKIGSHPVVRDYTRQGFPRGVPETFDGSWVEYRRFRMPSRNAGVPHLRQRRLNDQIKRKLPYFQLSSRSNGNAFMVVVEPRAAESGGFSDVRPDSYGLSTKTRAFSLPHIPVSG
jgi:hypothetical protein